MKLRSVALAGLLGTGILMTSGCGTEDIVDAFNTALKTNVIHLANARDIQVDFTIDGNSNLVNAQSSQMAVVTGNDNYVVTNTTFDSVATFPKDSAHLYALCSADSVITDSATTGAREIEVINLSATAIDAGIGQTVTVTLYDDANNTLATASLAGQTLAGCSREVLPISNFALSAVKTVEVNDVNYTIPAYSADVEAKLTELNDVDFDIVVFDAAAQKGTIVPLATATELAI